MVLTKETEKSGSKEKKIKTGSKEENTKTVKGAKAKKPSEAKFIEASIPQLSSKKELKKPATITSKDSDSARLDSSLSLGQAAKKSKTKVDTDSSSKPSKDGRVTTPTGALSSKKRAREEPAMESNQATSATKRKKLDQSTEKTVEKLSTREKRVAKVPSFASDDSEEEETPEKEVQVGEDEEVYLHGFSTDEDSSDGDEEIMDQDPLEVKNLPSKARDDAEVKRRLDAAKKKPTVDRGVLYIGRIPHGFYEEQIKEYFSQFGNVTRLRLARNKRTGRSKHYGFIEFDSSSVAEIVSETMNNYLLAGHLLQCKLIAIEKLHPDLWVGSNKKWKLIPKGRIARLAHNKTRTPAQQTRAEQRLLKRQAEKEAKLRAAGINYSLSKVGYTPAVSA